MLVSYVVHSDTNENNVLEEFSGRGSKQQAIAYAKRWIDSDPKDYIWVDKIYRAETTEEVINVEENVWSSEE